MECPTRCPGGKEGEQKEKRESRLHQTPPPDRYPAPPGSPSSGSGRLRMLPGIRRRAGRFLQFSLSQYRLQFEHNITSPGAWYNPRRPVTSRLAPRPITSCLDPRPVNRSESRLPCLSRLSRLSRGTPRGSAGEAQQSGGREKPGAWRPVASRTCPRCRLRWS